MSLDEEKNSRVATEGKDEIQRKELKKQRRREAYKRKREQESAEDRETRLEKRREQHKERMGDPEFKSIESEKAFQRKKKFRARRKQQEYYNAIGKSRSTERREINKRQEEIDKNRDLKIQEILQYKEKIKKIKNDIVETKEDTHSKRTKYWLWGSEENNQKPWYLIDTKHILKKISEEEFQEAKQARDRFMKKLYQDEASLISSMNKEIKVLESAVADCEKQLNVQEPLLSIQEYFNSVGQSKEAENAYKKYSVEYFKRNKNGEKESAKESNDSL
jgi:hypothetical protein